MKDISPKNIEIVSLRDKIIQPEEVASMAQQISGWSTESNELSKGKMRIQADQERILIGDATAPLTGIGMFMGLDGTDYEFRAGNPSGAYIHWDGTNLTVSSIVLTGGTISYGKTSFADTANAGYYISSSGIHFGQSAASYLKYTIGGNLDITGGAIDATSTIGGRTASTLASAIDSSGHFIDTVLNTSAKTILSDFTFSPSDYSGAFKTGDITWNTSTGAITGGSGVLFNKYGLLGATAGVATFVIDATTGNATFAGTLSGASGTFGTVTAGTMTGVTISGSVVKTVESFTCGENIVAGNCVCLKNGYDTSIYPSADTYVNENAATTNYDTATDMILGGVNNIKKEIFLKFDMSGVTSAENILKAELHFKVTNLSGFTWGSTIQYCTSDWSEDGTVTWNNRPTVETLTTKVGNKYTTGNLEILSDYYIDITELVRLWKIGSLDNYGLKLCGDGGIKNRTISSKENATVADRPYLRITSNQVSDGKIYKTDSDDYNLTRNIIGIATETKSATETCKVQTSGVNPNITCVVGAKYYVSTVTGEISASPANQARFYRIGIGTATNNLLIEKNDANLFIEKSKTY